MATLVRCIEGHAFDMAASETCPICGSTVWKKEPVEVKPPRDLTKAKAAAVGIGATFLLCAAIMAIVFGIKSVVQFVSHDNRDRTHLPSPHTPQETRNAILKKLGVTGGPDDKKTAPRPIKEIPNPFAPPQPQNPLDQKSANPFDKKSPFESR